MCGGGRGSACVQVLYNLYRDTCWVNIPDVIKLHDNFAWGSIYDNAQYFSKMFLISILIQNFERKSNCNAKILGLGEQVLIRVDDRFCFFHFVLNALLFHFLNTRKKTSKTTLTWFFFLFIWNVIKMNFLKKYFEFLKLEPKRNTHW